MKYTVESLKEMGYKGYQKNTWTGNTCESMYPLDRIAYAANKHPETLEFTRDDVRGTVRVRSKNTAWVPYSTLDVYIERPMTAAELDEAKQRLTSLGVSVTQA